MTEAASQAISELPYLPRRRSLPPILLPRTIYDTTTDHVELSATRHVEKNSLDGDGRVGGPLELPPDGSAVEDAEGELCAVLDVAHA